MYKLEHRVLVLAAKLRQRKALLAAFSMLDLDGNGRLSLEEFGALLAAVRPSHVQWRETIFDLLDDDGSGALEPREFLLAADALLLQLRDAPGSQRLSKAAECRRRCVTWRSARCRWLVHHVWFESFSMTSILAYVALLVVRARTPAAAQVSTTLIAVDLALLCLFVGEVLVKLLGLSLEGFWADGWNRFDAVVVPISVLSVFVELALLQTSGHASVGFLRVLRVMRLLRVTRAFALVSHSRRLLVLTRTLLQFRHAARPMASVMLSLLYVYASIGVEALAHTLDWAEEDFEGACGEACPSFNTFGQAVLTLFQVPSPSPSPSTSPSPSPSTSPSPSP